MFCCQAANSKHPGEGQESFIFFIETHIHMPAIFLINSLY